jgi:hypothetical protein
MARLIYSAIASLNGYVEDDEGRFDWAAPDDEVHAFVNDLERPIGTYLYRRRMYETMVYREAAGTGADSPRVSLDFAVIWRAAKKIVYSRTLQTVSSAKTRIERSFDPDAIRRLKETPATLGASASDATEPEYRSRECCPSGRSRPRRWLRSPRPVDSRAQSASLQPVRARR